MGETYREITLLYHEKAFSILKRIVMGETHDLVPDRQITVPFSILKRIVMGETEEAGLVQQQRGALSVSSSGS